MPSLCLFAAGSESNPTVYYGGFAFAGRVSEIEKNYSLSASLDKKEGDGHSYFENQTRIFFLRHATDISHISLKFDLVRTRDAPLVMALALCDEKILREEIGSFHKLVIQLGFELLVLDFRQMEVVSSVPVWIELIDARADAFSEEDTIARLRSMVAGEDSQLFAALSKKLGELRTYGANQCNLQIHAVSIGEKALPFLPESYRSKPDAYAETVARQFGSLLSGEGKLAMLPYAKDGLNSKMALCFSDAKVLQFKIPAPTFAIDVEVRGFKKVVSKSTPAETLCLYGAFLNLRVYEPEFNQVYFNAPVKYAVTKIIPASQATVDEFPVVSEALKGAFLSSLGQMQKDKTVFEKVLKKCAL